MRTIAGAMLRVLMLSTRYPDALRPGVGNFVERQAIELNSRPDIEVQMIAPIGLPPFPLSLRRHHRRAASLPRMEVSKGLRVHRPLFTAWPFRPRARVPALAAALLPVARKLRASFPFDLISAEFSWPEGPAAVQVGRTLGVPVSIKARGMEFERRISGGSTRRSLYAACANGDLLLAVSGAVRDRMVEAGLPADRIAVHLPGLDHDMFRVRDRSEGKAKLGIAGPLLVTVGNLIPEKAQHLAIRALVAIEGARLIVVGNGPKRRRLGKLVRSLRLEDRVSMPGRIPHEALPGLYAAADVLVHPSAVEGFANVRIEALACGTPVVTTAVGGAATIIDRAAAGRIVAADPGAISEAVNALLRDPPPRAEVAAAAETYSWERNARELEAHFRAVTNLSRP